MLENASTQEDRRYLTDVAPRAGAEFRGREKVRCKNGCDSRPIRSARVHHSHHAFVMIIAGVVMEAAVQPRRSRHRKTEQKLKSERENQRPL